MVMTLMEPPVATGETEVAEVLAISTARVVELAWATEEREEALTEEELLTGAEVTTAAVEEL